MVDPAGVPVGPLPDRDHRPVLPPERGVDELEQRGLGGDGSVAVTRFIAAENALRLL